MTTLMQWSKSEGIKGRCNSNCHHAEHPDCVCMCGGRYHGKARTPGALEAAVAETWEDVVAAARRRAQAEGFELMTHVLQPRLPL
jgi:hypothetical protein